MSKSAFKWSDDQINELIELVRENEAIFNTKHYNHRNRDAIDRIWSKIDMQLKKPPGVCREQWQKLRICYRRNFTLDGPPKARWRFYDKLNFLSDFLRFIDPENSLTKCIKRAEEKYCSQSVDLNRTQNTKIEEDDEKPDDQSKSEDNISIYYLSDDEITLQNGEQAASDDDNDIEYHLVEYIQDENEALTCTSKHEPNRTSKKSINRNLRKRNYHNHIDTEVSETNENVSSSKDEYETVEIIKETERKKIRSNSPISKHEAISTVAQKIVSLPEEVPNTSVSCLTKSPVTIEQQPVNSVTCLCQNDPDTIFLRSILEDFKSMSKKNKCSFKIQVQKAIQDILYPDDD